MSSRYPQPHPQQAPGRRQQPHQQPQHAVRSQSRGVPAQLPQLHPSHDQPRADARQQQRQGSSSGSRRATSGSEEGGDQARPRGRPRQQQPEPESEQQVGLNAEQRSQIQRYIELDDQIGVLNNQLKALRSERKELEDEVLAIVRPLRSGAIKTGNTVLRAKKTKKKQGLNQKVWAEKLAASGQLRDPNNAPALVKHVYKSLSTTEDYELVRE